MTQVFIDDIEVDFDDALRLNGIEAAARGGVEIPRYCWHPGLSVVASCRMCLVETGKKDPESGEISMLPKLVPACQTPATNGVVFVTNSEKVKQARAMIEEDLLLRHPIDCPICDKAGECQLQDYHFEHGREERRADLKPFTSRRREMGETVTLFVDRCVMCTRCVRFTREITGTNELMIINRGSHEEIDVFEGYPLDNKMSGNVVDLCPVGALGDVDFLYKQRVWFMQKQASVCSGCSAGCSIDIEENQDQLYRIKPRENPHVNQWWICDEGRYGHGYVHDRRRNTEVRRQTSDGAREGVEWSEVLRELDRQFRKAKNIAAIVSPFLTVEESFLLCEYFQSLDADLTIVLGPIPTKGEDESYPQGFTIRAEKCPNRKGVEAILARRAEAVLPFSEWLENVTDTALDALWITGGYPEPWHASPVEEALVDVETVVVHDIFPSPLYDSADYQLPGAASAERAGSYVNHAHRLQSFDWAIRPPAGVLSDGQVFWQLLQREGMYDPRAVLDEIARTIITFASAAGPVPDVGIDLRTDMLVNNESTAPLG